MTIECLNIIVTYEEKSYWSLTANPILHGRMAVASKGLQTKLDSNLKIA